MTEMSQNNSANCFWQGKVKSQAVGWTDMAEPRPQDMGQMEGMDVVDIQQLD